MSRRRGHHAWALRAYPRAYRAERGDEILSTMLDAAGPRGPRLADDLNVVAHGLRTRLRPQPAHPWSSARRRTGVATVLVLLIASLTTGVVAATSGPGATVVRLVIRDDTNDLNPAARTVRVTFDGAPTVTVRLVDGRAVAYVSVVITPDRWLHVRVTDGTHQVPITRWHRWTVSMGMPSGSPPFATTAHLTIYDLGYGLDVLGVRKDGGRTDPLFEGVVAAEKAQDATGNLFLAADDAYEGARFHWLGNPGGLTVPNPPATVFEALVRHTIPLYERGLRRIARLSHPASPYRQVRLLDRLLAAYAEAQLASYRLWVRVEDPRAPAPWLASRANELQGASNALFDRYQALDMALRTRSRAGVWRYPYGDTMIGVPTIIAPAS